ncbi:hypothetical protein NliqN6_1353, partial [Naganishia liquefaciens]
RSRYSKMTRQPDLPTRTPSELSSESDRKDASIDDVKEVHSPSSELDEKRLITPPPPLADRTSADPATGFGDAILRLLKIRKKRAGIDLDSVATQESVFDTDQGVYYHPKPTFENFAAFDINFRWTWKEEIRIRRKIDLKIFLWVLTMFMALDIDRYNLANATADNFLEDLKLTQADYNLGNTLSKVGFLAAELPSQLVSKRLGPDRWIPMQMVGFSTVAACQFWLTGRKSFLATRFLIAFLQGGFIPDMILYLSYWYKSSELPLRMGFFYVINYASVILTGFLAVGILQMRGIGGLAGWRYMFLIEGLLTLAISIASFFLMPANPSATKTWFRPKGYFSDREIKVIVNRVLRDDPTKSTMHNRQALPVKTIFRCICDYDMIPMYLIGLLFGIGSYPVQQYFQISMKQLGFSTLESNLLSIPNAALSIINLLVITVISEVVDNRAFVSMAENLWMLPNYIALLTLPDPISGWTYFAVSTVLLGFPYVHAIQVAWCSRNSGSVEARSVVASLYNMSVQVSALIGANLYQASDKPRYYKANKAIVGIICFNLVILYPGTSFYYRWRNRQRAKIWDAMTSEEKSNYLQTTKDKGNKKLDFRFIH